MLESHQGVHFLVQVAIARRELVAERMQNPEIDLVSAVGIGRMAIRFDLRGVVVKHVEDVVAFMFLSADGLRVDGDMIG